MTTRPFSVLKNDGSSPPAALPPVNVPLDGRARHPQQAPLPGIYRDTPMDVYHRWSAASNSRLTLLRRSPAHLKAYLDGPPVERSAFTIGRAAHATILEPDTFANIFAVAGQCEATKKGDGLRCANAGVALHADLGWLCGVHQRGVPNNWSTTTFVLPEEDYTSCLRMRDAVNRHASASRLLSGAGDVELSLVWEQDGLDVLCKGRLDRLSPGIAGGAIVDIKTTRDASPREFERAIFTHGYHRQAAFYLDGARAHGIPAKHFVIIAVEKEPPYAVAVYRVSEGAIDAGQEQLRVLLAKYAECEQKDEWPAYPDVVRDIALPDWAWKQIDEETTTGVGA